MQKITCTSSSFEDMRNKNLLYVDKTEYIWKMVSSGSSGFFLIRPRRFGKSLAVTTLKALFEGKHELFKDLAIDSKPYDWKAYPVIHLNLTNCCPQSAEDLKIYLLDELKRNMEALQIQVDISTPLLSIAFSRLIRGLYAQKGKVVVLIDEYDKPLLENLTNGKAAEIRDVLSEFYVTLKKEDACEHFVFLTGVTKFCQVSVFSKLNNLKDISMDQDYATMLGYTQAELEKYFSEWIADAESRQSMPHEQYMAQIKQWYDGFRFCKNAETVYNPFSVASFLDNHGDFDNYWFSTGTPTFLIELLKQKQYDLEKALKEPVDRLAFAAYEIENLDPITLLLQTGYLTIKSVDTLLESTLYHLYFPNKEVKNAFNTFLLNAYADIKLSDVSLLVRKLYLALSKGQTSDFMDVLQTFLANIPYDIQLPDEKYYQTVIFVLFLTLGTIVEAESRTNKGRIDAVIALDKLVYILEFKINQSAQEALEQIRDREYYQRYRHSGRQIHLLGINISTEKRQITEWKEELDP